MNTNVGMVKPIKRWSFEYFYFIVMFFYAFQLCPATLRMRFGLSGDPIPFILPIALTGILLFRNKVRWTTGGIGKVLVILLFWVLLITIKYSDTSISFFSYNFFLIYAVIVAYIHAQVYGTALFDIYEDILVKFSFLSLILWTFQVTLPGVAATVFHLFPEYKASTGAGNHIFLLYNWFDPSLSMSAGQAFRNSGASFEPGHFSVMLSFGIFFNLLKNGVRFKNNRNFVIMLLALLTTFSTTGYCIAFITIFVLYIKTHTFKLKFPALFVGSILLFLMFQLDFMGNKLSEKMNVQEANENFYNLESYYTKTEAEANRASLDRFQSMYFEWINFVNEPLLGYSRETKKSWFRKNFLDIYSLTGGLVKILAQFGIIFGLIIYYMLFKSSKAIARNFSSRSTMMFAIIMILGLISYNIFDTPILTAFWLYGMWNHIPECRFVG